MAKDTKIESAGATPLAQDTTPPAVISGAPENVDNHALPIAPREWAGQYRITHGSVRLGDKFYGVGSVLQLGADDGKNFTEAGIAERVEG